MFTKIVNIKGVVNMSEKIQEAQQRLKDLGYFASEDLAKIVLLFEASGKREMLMKNLYNVFLEWEQKIFNMMLILKV